jgi:hypothetical protein
VLGTSRSPSVALHLAPAVSATLTLVNARLGRSVDGPLKQATLHVRVHKGGGGHSDGLLLWSEGEPPSRFSLRAERLAACF